jgi:hypothetical protein
MFLALFSKNMFLRGENQDALIAIVMAEHDQTYETMSNALELGLANGTSIDVQLTALSTSMKILLEL